MSTGTIENASNISDHRWIVLEAALCNLKILMPLLHFKDYYRHSGHQGWTKENHDTMKIVPGPALTALSILRLQLRLSRIYEGTFVPRRLQARW